ncbi:MAG TPA: hypothetical protein VL688_10150 [Verrucomicrobiae bacterium]|nr:hypothetical protein [Verrucomicrobiae bacterium]
MALVSICLFSAGCSGWFWGGTGAGAGGTATAYELRARQQLQQIEDDYKAGKIDQREYEIRKDQIEKGSVVY